MWVWKLPHDATCYCLPARTQICILDWRETRHVCYRPSTDLTFPSHPDGTEQFHSWNTFALHCPPTAGSQVVISVTSRRGSLLSLSSPLVVELMTPWAGNRVRPSRVSILRWGETLCLWGGPAVVSSLPTLTGNRKEWTSPLKSAGDLNIKLKSKEKVE